MVIEYHWKYMERLAQTYLSIYGRLGYDEAKKWYNGFLDAGHRKRIRPFITAIAESQNLEVD